MLGAWNMRTKWFIGFSVLTGLVFLGALSYLLTRNGPGQASDSNQLPSAANITNEAGKEFGSERAGESMSQRARETAGRAESSWDFSGVTTIDPALPTPATTPAAEPKPKSTAPLPLV